MMSARTPLQLILCVLLALAFGAASADQVYKWVDKDGRVHFSQTPPPGAATGVRSMQVNAPPPDPTGQQNAQNLQQEISDKNQKAEDAQKQADQEAQKKAQQQKACDGLRERMQVLQSSGRAATVDAKGNMSYISDEDRAKQIQDLQKQIDSQCKG